MAAGKELAGYFVMMIAGAAVVGFVGAYAAAKGAQMAGGFPLAGATTTSSSMRVPGGYGLLGNPNMLAVPGGYGKGSHPNIL